MSNLSEEEILKLIKEISLDKDEKIFSSDLIEDIVIKEGHVQISIFANKDNFQILEKVGKKIEETLKKSINALSITSVLTNHIENNQIDQKDDQVDKKDDYTNINTVTKEIDDAKRIFNKMGWPTIDTTRRSVEETAAAIMNIRAQKWKLF